MVRQEEYGSRGTGPQASWAGGVTTGGNRGGETFGISGGAQAVNKLKPLKK